MSKRSDHEEFFEQAFPSAEDQAPYIGKVVAFDNRTGAIRDSADTFEELVDRHTDESLDGLALLYIPGVPFIA